MTRNRRSSSFDNTAIGIMQTTAQERQDIPMPPGTGCDDGIKSEQRVALIHRLTQMTLQSDAL